jgi:isopentenyl-diphosphate delta-isomerase type 1
MSVASVTPTAGTPAEPRRAVEEAVVLLDEQGRAIGSTPKRSVHGPDTPLHLGFSCHVVGADGRLLLTRRAATKRTWPATWTNGCCGHPLPGESLRDAVTRRLSEELGLAPGRMALALPDFTYRAVMDNGIVEHELCPVVVAEVVGTPRLNPDEVDDATWVSWDRLRERARTEPASLSPWAVAQIEQLADLGPTPDAWLDAATAPNGVLAASVDVAAAPSAPRCVVARPPAVDPFTAVRTRVDAVLEQFLSSHAAGLRAIDPALGPVSDAIRGLVAAGGKRLRPAFVYWGHQSAAAGDRNGDCDTELARVVTVAAAVELLHAFALLHDDVMDRSATRRGRPTAHWALAAVHRASGWNGDDEWFGTSAAILAGDLTFVWADELFDAARLSHGARDRARQAFTTLRTEVMAGQYLDLRLAARAEATETDARRVALLKSGRYTVTRPLELGLALASQPPAPALAAALAAYGDAVGIAFQLRDDVLGLFGDPHTTGKGRDDDLREGKRTLLVLRALALTTGADHRFLASALGNPALTDADGDRCRAIVAGSGALASVEARLRAEHDTARATLAVVPEPARGALDALARVAIERER